MTTIPATDVRRLARLVTRVEMTMVLTRPWTRTNGILVWAIIILITAELTLVLPWPTILLAVIGSALIAFVGVCVITTVVLLITETRLGRKAPGSWYTRDTRGERGAYIRRRPDQQLELCSVTAAPRGHGLGEELLTQILADLPDGTNLHLVAVNRRVAAWYARHGFRPAPRTLRGIPMTRPANRPTPNHS